MHTRPLSISLCAVAESSHSCRQFAVLFSDDHLYVVLKNFTHVSMSPEVGLYRLRGDGKYCSSITVKAVCLVLMQVLVFEDAPNGVEGALAAGMQVVWVPDPNCVLAIQKTGSSGPRPTLTLSSLQEFDPQVFGLPVFCQ